jgi:DNA polymerase-3 subunit epsilon
VLGCQASGATPAYGDLLAMGWAFSGSEVVSPVRDYWIKPRTTRTISRPVRELTGWSEEHLAIAHEDSAVWQQLRSELQEHAGDSSAVPTVIHFARFELGFLRELQARLEPEREFPFDACCLHAISARLYPDLPRRNIRALAGFLGHTTDLTRHAGGHVEASAFIWQALIPQLAEQGVTTWSELQAWLADAPKATRRTRRVYPLSVERRRELPDRPGVYRFVRKNESVLYVGKAASLKKRIAGHFSSRGPSTERGLELLSQVHAVRYTETPSVLEAALLETDEIKRIDPPYNVQLRTALRQAWFATRDFRKASARQDAEHALGPLPSESALIGLFAWRVLLDELCDESVVPSTAMCAMILAVPTAFLPPPELFREGFQLTVRELFAGLSGSAAQRVTRASRALWLARGRNERESSTEDAPPDQWDLARVRRRLERSLVNGGLVLRRARLLRLLADCTLGYREVGMPQARALVIERTEIIDRIDLPLTAAGAERPSVPEGASPQLKAAQPTTRATALESAASDEGAVSPREAALQSEVAPERAGSQLAAAGEAVSTKRASRRVGRRSDPPLPAAGSWSLVELPVRAVLSLAERRSCFDAASYDRLRVLVTEIRRVEQEGGELALRIGRHHYAHARVLALLQAV